MNEIQLDNQLIKRYAKKIMGFAYSKTRHLQTAEDLSQDILVSLSSSLGRHEQIDDLDGFVYTICMYTWSKFLRTNKKYWNNLDVDDLFDLNDGNDLEEDAQNKAMMEKLRFEIAYLSKLHRQITLLTYYENKTGDEVSKMLNIPHSTVRWHLGEIRSKLKAGIEMTATNLNYKPQRLSVGHDGYTLAGYHQCGLGEDRLVDNICIACYGKTLTIEEIARTLMVAAGYLEVHIERLVYMDYLKVIDKNRYTTNFFISDKRIHLLENKFDYYHIGPYAKKIYEAFDTRFDRIKAIGFLGSDLDRDFIQWALIPIVSKEIIRKSIHTVLDRHHIKVETPKHKDGSQHWVCAGFVDDQFLEAQNEFTKEEVDFYHKSRGNGIKIMSDNSGHLALQLESYATIQLGINWRNLSDSSLEELVRIAAIIKNGEEPNELDKLIIAKQAKEGYVRMENGRLQMLIPFFNKPEYDALSVILDEIYAELGEEMLADYVEEHAKIISKEMPSFISEDERNYHVYKVYPNYSILYWLSDNGFLRYPTDEEAKRLCTVVWCER